MRSEPASGASPATGPATEARRKRLRRGNRRGGDPGKSRQSHKKAFVEVVLEPQTWRHAGWAGFHLVVGSVLIYGLGSVGKGLGVLLLILGGLRGYKFARGILAPPGRLKVGVDPVELPAGLSVASADEIAVDSIKQVFYLRRALPWTQASPVLVVETADDTIYTYPRDWFASDSDQRRVARTLAEQIGRANDDSLIGGAASSSGKPEAAKKNATQIGIAAFVTAIALFVAALLPRTQAMFRSINLPVVLLYIGAALSLGVAMWHLIGLPDYDDSDD